MALLFRWRERRLCIFTAGEQFEVLQPARDNPQAISSGFVRSLLQTRSGRIFVGTPPGWMNTCLPNIALSIGYGMSRASFV